MQGKTVLHDEDMVDATGEDWAVEVREFHCL